MKKLFAILVSALLLCSAVLTSCGSYSDVASSDNGAKYEEMLNSRVSAKTDGEGLNSPVVIVPAEKASSVGIDTSSLWGGGYIIRTEGEETVIIGTDDDMLDRAIRYFTNNCIDQEGDLLSESANYVYTVDNRVKSITLSGADISEYVITIPDNASECTAYAAEELAKYIQKSCLARLEIKTAPVNAKHTIALEIDPTATGGGLYDSGELGSDGYRITVSDGKMKIVGGNMRGCAYGVYDFLEKYVGWRFLATDSYYLYESDGIVIDNVDYTETPRFSYRGTTYSGTTLDNVMPLRDNTCDAWSTNRSARTGYGTGTMWYHAHSFAYQVDGYAPSDIYGNESALGLDYWTQPCFTDQTVRDNIVQSMMFLLEERVDGWGFKIGYDATFISCSMNDNTDFCICQNCRKGMRDEGSMAGPYLELVNYAAAAVEERYPGMMVYAITYIKEIPKTVRPADNVVIHFCISGCNNHALADGECDCYRMTTLGRNNVTEFAALKDWASICDNFYVWYYASCFNAYLAPAPIMTHFAEDMQTLNDMDIDGVYIESSYREDYHYFNRVQKYLSYKLMWDPDVTDEEYNAMIDEFLRLVYGDSWEALREYMDMSEKATEFMGCWTNNYNYPFDMVSPAYYAEYYEHMRTLFDEAIELAPSAEVETKVRKALLSVDFLGLSATYESEYVNGDSQSKALYEERYRALIDGCRDYEITVWSDDTYKCPETYSLEKGPMENFYKLADGAKEY